MIQENNLSASLSEQDGFTQRVAPDRNKGKLDLIVLRYIVHKLRLVTQLQEQTANMRDSRFYYADEHHQRMHRITIYDINISLSELQHCKSLVFVGFVSKKRQLLSASIINSIYEVDKTLITELQSAAGLLSYSSLELRRGNWYNLVLLSDHAAKNHIQGSGTHKYAAYQLAPRYYEWIRLHSGIIAGGLDDGQLMLQHTKYYTFHESSSQAEICEFTSEISLPLQGYEPEHTSLISIRPLPL
jgi:hypothetical protein